MRIEIEINRATAHGVDQCGGYMFEAHGFQFCITNSFDEGRYHAIELTTGVSICSRFVCDYSTEKKCIDSIQSWIKRHRDNFAPSLIEKGKALLSEYGLNYPLNALITEEEKEAKKAERRVKRWATVGGEPKKLVARLDPIQWERASRIRDKYGFKSIYEMNQYLWGCFLRVADPEHEDNPTPVPDEIESMFGGFSESEKHFEFVKPKRAKNIESLNNNKYNLKPNQL